MPPCWRERPEPCGYLCESELADADAFLRAEPRVRAAVECVLSMLDRKAPGASLAAWAERLCWFEDWMCDPYGRDASPGHCDWAFFRAVFPLLLADGRRSDGVAPGDVRWPRLLALWEYVRVHAAGVALAAGAHGADDYFDDLAAEGCGDDYGV